MRFGTVVCLVGRSRVGKTRGFGLNGGGSLGGRGLFGRVGGGGPRRGRPPTSIRSRRPEGSASLWMMARRLSLATVQWLQVDGDSFGDETGQQVEDRVEGIMAGDAGRTSQARAVAENPVDHPRTRASGTDLDERADAIVVGVGDDGGKVESVQSVAEDRVGGRFAVGSVRAAGGAAVEPNAGRRRGRQQVHREVTRARPGGRRRSGPC